jgi:hypothetical protein
MQRRFGRDAGRLAAGPPLSQRSRARPERRLTGIG